MEQKEEAKVKRKRGGDNGKRKPVIEDGEKWCACTKPSLTHPIGRGQAFCLKCFTPYYH